MRSGSEMQRRSGPVTLRKQKTDKRDAAHILKLVVEGRFPRLWTPDREQRDLRQLVLHRHKLVIIRSRVKNELQHLSRRKLTSSADSVLIPWPVTWATLQLPGSRGDPISGPME